MNGATVVLLALAWVGVGCRPSPVVGDEVPTMVVERTPTFVRHVKADGTLKAVEATPLTPPPDAREPLKVIWVAADGSQVEPGDVVVRFDASEMERRLEDSRDDLSMAERKIGKVGIDGATSTHKRDMTAELADDEADVARKFLSKDDKVFSRNEIIESAIDVEFAEAKAGHARAVKQIESAVSSNAAELHRIERGHASREVQRSSESLAKLQVTATHAGIVVLARNWLGQTVRVGDTVFPGQKIAELPHVAAMEADLFVLEADAANLAVGLPAEVVIEAHPHPQHAGKVKRVDTLAKPRHAEVPVHYFGVTIELEKTDPKIMRVGQRVRATIRIEQPDAIVVPRQAIFDRAGKPIVYRRTDGEFEFEPVDVTLGMSSAGRVVIASGLDPGQEIALRDPTKDPTHVPGDDTGEASSKGEP